MKRRDFIQKSSFASAALIGAVPSAFPNTVNKIISNEQINIGIIGTGNRGNGLIKYLNEIDGFNIIACCDILPFRLTEGLKMTNDRSEGYKDYRKLLENKALDAVLIATPFSTHAKIAIDALDAGKHVYCEKTLAKGYDGIKNLFHKANSSEKIFQNGHQYQSSKLYQHVVELVRNGKIGKISSLECQYNRNGDWRRSVPKPEFEKTINWRMYREFSGGLVAELCSHQIDFANWLLGENPEKVMGLGGIDYWKDGRETYDNVHLLFSYPNGVKAKFTSLTSNAHDNYKIKILGDKGTIILDYERAWFHPEGSYEKELGNVDGVAGATLKWEEGKGIPLYINQVEPSRQALVNFKNNIIENKEPASNILSGAKSAICVQMALEAMHNEEIIAWQNDIVP